MFTIKFIKSNGDRSAHCCDSYYYKSSLNQIECFKSGDSSFALNIPVNANVYAVNSAGVTVDRFHYIDPSSVDLGSKD